MRSTRLIVRAQLSPQYEPEICLFQYFHSSIRPSMTEPCMCLITVNFLVNQLEESTPLPKMINASKMSNASNVSTFLLPKKMQHKSRIITQNTHWLTHACGKGDLVIQKINSPTNNVGDISDKIVVTLMNQNIRVGHNYFWISAHALRIFVILSQRYTHTHTHTHWIYTFLYQWNNHFGSSLKDVICYSN